MNEPVREASRAEREPSSRQLAIAADTANRFARTRRGLTPEERTHLETAAGIMGIAAVAKAIRDER